MAIVFVFVNATAYLHTKHNTMMVLALLKPMDLFGMDTCQDNL